jgi:hypothetical protein
MITDYEDDNPREVNSIMVRLPGGTENLVRQREDDLTKSFLYRRATPDSHEDKMTYSLGVSEPNPVRLIPTSRRLSCVSRMCSDEVSEEYKIPHLARSGENMLIVTTLRRHGNGQRFRGRNEIWHYAR